MSNVDEALNSLTSIDDLLLDGKEVDVSLSAAITSVTITRTIVGASTLDWNLNDNRREILQSGIIGDRVLMHCGQFPFELVAVQKSGKSLTITGEDQAVGALRRQTAHLKIKKGVMTHVEFAKKLVDEVPWLKFKTDTSAHVVKSKEDLVRGAKNSNSTGDGPGSSWDALQSNASARGWRCFIKKTDEVWYVPDSFMFAGDPEFILEEGKNGVDTIDFRYDKGQRLASLTVTARAALWKVPCGSTAQVVGAGVADGKWLVQDISRSPLTLPISATLIKPQPVLPEPKDSSAGGSGGGGGTSSTLSSSPSVRVAQYAINAGFKGQDLQIAVAVSYAEDGNHDPKRVSAQNSDGSYDRGLWQINTIHKEYSNADMADGQKNANAAWAISSHGNNWDPWTTYKSGAYKKYLPAAQRAIDAAHKLVSNKGGGAAPDPSHTKRALDFVAEALAERGKAYVYGAQTSPSNNDPKSFDCSLLVEWAAGRVGITLPRTAQDQYAFARDHGRLISVKHASRVRGAVLYEGTYTGADRTGLFMHHTAISLGNGETIEARGAAYGVNEFGIANRGFNYAALIPGMKY